MATASEAGFPVSREMSCAISSSSFRMIFRAWIMSRARSRKDLAAQAGCALRARPTARATSSGNVKGARPISSPVAGSRETISAPVVFAGILCALGGDYRMSEPPAVAGG
jgi:hypothetical protein